MEFRVISKKWGVIDKNREWYHFEINKDGTAVAKRISALSGCYDEYDYDVVLQINVDGEWINVTDLPELLKKTRGK